MVIIGLIILGLYIALSYYIGLKGKQAITHIGANLKNKINLIIYWIVYWGIALEFIFNNIFRGLLPTDNWITESAKLIGAVYLGFFIYSILMFAFVDMLRFILKKINPRESVNKKLKKIYCNGIPMFLIIFIIVGFGAWNAQNKVITNYELNIDKKAGEITSLNVVMISDAHIGIGVRENAISKMVNSINQLNPDIVVFCGDMFDESTSTKLKEYSRDAFKNIKSKYGIYAITGNHEYGAGDLSDTISYYKAANVIFLQDESVKIADSFYIVGLNDPGNRKVTGYEGKSLNEILNDVDKSLPIIELNHRPERLGEAEIEKVDLQLSGHTHSGQVFPGNLIINSIYEDAYGYLKKGDFNLIVSSGYGTWGPPIRTGSKSEIVKITINLKK
jgi:predicted MPP superfamily phosphohydrolase